MEWNILSADCVGPSSVNMLKKACYLYAILREWIKCNKGDTWMYVACSGAG